MNKNLNSNPSIDHTGVVDTNILKLYNKFKSWATEENKLDSTSIISLVIQLIPEIQRMVTEPGKGSYKKIVVITVLEQIISDSKLPNDQKQVLYNIVKYTIPITIDTMIGIAYGDIDIAKYIRKNPNCCLLS